MRKRKVRQKGKERRFSQRIVNSGANPERMQEYYTRARNLGVDQRYLDAKFPGRAAYTTEELVLKQNPRGQVLVKLWQSEERGRQGHQEYHYVKIYGGRFEELRLYFGGMHWFFVKQSFIFKNIFSSIIYPSRELAYTAMERGNIVWNEPFVITQEV